MYAVIGLALAFAVSAYAQVTATGTMGPTNPPQPTAPTAVNQTSMARLLSLESVDDWCVFAPPEPGVTIGDSEAFEVAWCTKPRNNARVIPDGVVTGVSFLKTDFYVQLMAYGDFTKLNVQAGDYGGELDPHGATGEGNPVGGNVTTSVATGSDVNYEEWMMFMAADQVCFRICTNANSTYPAASMCEHKLDVMGCNFVMPGNYNFNGTFESCDADVAYPPGWYPDSVGGATTSFSTFAQYFTGVYTGGDGLPTSYTVGDLVTPTAAFSTPSSSNCQTTSTISNGLSDLAVATGSSTGSAVSGSVTGSASGNKASSSGSSTGSASSASSTSGNGAASSMGYHDGVTLAALVSAIAAIAMFH